MIGDGWVDGGNEVLIGVRLRFKVMLRWKL